MIVSRGEPEKKVEEVKVTKKVTHVPNVENASLSIAEDGIEGRGLHVGAITYQDSNQAEGTVVAQYPSPDSEVELGSSVDLVIARRPEPEPEPAREPENVREPEPQSNEFPDIPIQNDVPSREGDQAKER